MTIGRRHVLGLLAGAIAAGVVVDVQASGLALEAPVLALEPVAELEAPAAAALQVGDVITIRMMSTWGKCVDRQFTITGST